MSNSYKKNAKHSRPAGRGKNDKQVGNRKKRHRWKQYINTRFHWDDFLLPNANYVDDWYSDWDYYCSCRYTIPAINQCELDYHKKRHYGWQMTWLRRDFNDGHFSNCNCYTNKRSYWWKAKRK